MGKRLTARLIENLGPGRYSDGGGLGLMLWVSKNESRTWVQRLTVAGKRRDIGLGPWPVVTLAKARDQAMTNRRAVWEGRDPIDEKRLARAEARRRITFADAAPQACQELSSGWLSPKEPRAFMSSLERYAFPFFGNHLISDVSPTEIRRAILACREVAPNTATKVQRRILAVFKWAIAEGLRTGNPANAEALALPKMEFRPKYNRALPYAEVTQAIDKVKASEAGTVTKLALEFTALTACRSGEVRGARWEEIDWDAKLWEIPAERMKMRRAHRVPLSDRAIEILRMAEPLGDKTTLIFPSARGRRLSDVTLSKLLRDLGIDSTVHGLRASFRTWTQEQTNAPYEVAEAALAHVKGDKTEAAYARSDLFDKRRKLMDAWSSYLAVRRGEVLGLQDSS